jgi:hypothetical protein
MTPKEKKAFVARMKKGRAAAKKNKKKSGADWKTSHKGMRSGVFLPTSKGESIRVKLLLDDYKSGRNWKSDPPRSKIEKSGSLAGWLSYAKKFRISTTQAKKVW